MRMSIHGNDANYQCTITAYAEELGQRTSRVTFWNLSVSWFSVILNLIDFESQPAPERVSIYL